MSKAVLIGGGIMGWGRFTEIARNGLSAYLGWPKR